MEEVLGTLRAQSIEPEGPIFAHHLRLDPASFDFEVGVPVAVAFSPAGRVRASHIPASQVVRATYTGPYDGILEAWSELTDWIRANGLVMAPNFWEVYQKGPESTPDSNEWRTELNRPIIS